MNPGDSLKDDAVAAAFELTGRTGARALQLGYLHDTPPHQWYASAEYHGARITVENQAGPVEAAEGLVRRLLDGARCMYCAQTVVLEGDAEGCRWTREGRRWQPGCGGVSEHTTSKLARALGEVPGMDKTMIHRALDGYYHDFLSPLATPEMQLVADLRALASAPATPRDSRPKIRALADRVINGDFDASKEESDAWASSPEGQAVFAELTGLDKLLGQEEP